MEQDCDVAIFLPWLYFAKKKKKKIGKEQEHLKRS